ncbi:MAG: riboflavin biosynthesis protein RibD [Blastopirellula sp.]|nr:MAG: riboflavin biosynthesis protein RibD [Blastopirellula sp.]
MSDSNNHNRFMLRALELAQQGEGLVEPNPMVGCLLVKDNQIIAEGYHHQYGQAHAEADALANCTSDPAGATAYVTLEPCCHTGKTPPCSAALIQANVAKVVIAQRDPFSQVNGGGIEQLEAAGIEVEIGLLEHQAKTLNAPYLKLVQTGMPWVIAKWAMTLDGKIASRTGSSQWISNESSRKIVHEIRGRVDAILVGSNTAKLDNPQLTARPTGMRTAARVVIDSQATLSPESKLAQTANEIPVIVAVSPTAKSERLEALQNCGCELLFCDANNHATRMQQLLEELGKRRMTNILVEGGSSIFGTLMELGQIDEVYSFIAPKLIGGSAAPTPMAGQGLADMQQAVNLTDVVVTQLEENVLVHGRVDKRPL